MLTFAAEFPVQDSSPEKLARCVADWLRGSPYRKFSHSDIDKLEETISGQVSADNQQIEAEKFGQDEEESVAFRHIAVDGDIQWTTTIIFYRHDGEMWVSVRTDHASASAVSSVQQAKKPQIVKFILSEIGGGLDGELFVSDTPHELAESDVNMAVRLLNGDSANQLPVVYVSRASDQSLAINPAPLAKALGGLAHVVVEPSRRFSFALRDDTQSGNAYGGAVGIYYPTGERTLMLPKGESDHDLRFDIGFRVRRSLLVKRPHSRGTWSNVEAMRGRRELEKLRELGSTDVDAYAEAFDKELNALQEKVVSAEEENARLKNELFVANQRLSSAKNSTSLSTNTQDYFPNEAEEFLRDAIQGALGGLSDESRRYEILREVLSGIPASDEAQKRKEQLKEALRGARGLDAGLKDTLTKLGFEIDSSGKHHKLTYQGDERYTFTMAKTASDHRAGLNMSSEISKRIY